MVRPVVLALLCWSVVSVPAMVILGRIMRGPSKTPTAPTVDPATAAEQDELAAADTLTRDLEPTPL